LAFGSWLAFTRTEDGLAARAARLVLLHVALLPSALGSTQLAARRVAAATHLRYHGVLVERTRSVTIGSGVDHADVHLPTLSPDQPPWRLTVRRGAKGWAIDRASDAEQLRLSPVAGYEPTTTQRLAELLRRKGLPFHVTNAALVSTAAPGALLRLRSGGWADTISLASVDGRLTLRSAALGEVFLDPVDARLSARYRRLLAAGTPVSALDARRPASRNVALPIDRLVRVQELSASRHVNGDWEPSLPFRADRRRFLVSAGAPLVVDPASPADTALRLLGDSTRVEVRHAGGLWRFDLVTMQRTQAADSGLSVRFVTTPRVLDIALPAAGECDEGVACGALSLRPLPPPIGHISLASAGLDTARFAFLAKLRTAGSGLAVALGQEEVVVPRGTGLTAVPVDSIEREEGQARRPTARPSRWLLLSAANNSLNGVWQLVLVAVGLVVLLLTVHELVLTVGVSTIRGGAVTESALALGLSALLALLTTRVVVGARVTFFPPENPAGLDTAIGMFVAIAIATLGLLLWDRWVPHLLGGTHALVSTERGALRQWWRAARDAGNRVVGERRRRRARLPWLVGILVADLVILFVVSRTAVLMGGSAGVLVVSVWLLLAWIGAFGGTTFHAFAQSPCDVVEHDPGAGLGNGIAVGQLVRLCVQWALTLWNPVGGILACLVLFWIGDLVYIVRAWRGPGGRDAAAARLLVALASVASTLVIAALKLQSANGAMASFLLIILVSLTSVRIGRSLSSRLQQHQVASTPTESRAAIETPTLVHALVPEGSSTPLSRWTVISYLVAPILLLAPLAVIDMGLLLVTVIPIGAASLLAVGWRRVDRWGRMAAAFFALLLAGFLWFKVLFPPLGAIGSREASYVARADHFDGMQGLFGIPVPIPQIRASLERTAARAVATRDQRAAERLLVAARPGNARDLLMPSIEQVWGGRAYSAAGINGQGQGTAPTRGHGIAEAVSYAENSFAVYVLYEHGALGGVFLLTTYLVFAWAVLVAMHNSVTLQAQAGGGGASLRASRALFLVAALLVAIPASYVALSNVGVVPITGQNIPFLGLNAWSDVTLAAGVCGMLLTAAIRTQAMQRRGT